MPIKYKPVGTSHPSEGLSNASVGNVVDLRGTPSDWLGAIRGGYGNPLKKLYTEEETALIIEKAFEDALESRGVLAPEKLSEYRVDITLHKFDTNYYFNKEAHANLTVSLFNKPTNLIVFTNNYRTDNKKVGVGAGMFGSVESLADFANETLNETIDKAIDDPAFLAALSKRTPPAEIRNKSIKERLGDLQMLLDDGLISLQQYEAKRSEILHDL
jgi:hypothetical protein